MPTVVASGAGAAPALRADLPAPTYPLASVDKALRLLLLFRGQQALRLSEASALLGVGRSTTHRLLAMLQYYGFVRQEPDTRVYVAAPALADPGSGEQSSALRDLAHPYLEFVSRRLDLSAHIATLQGPSLVFVDSVQTSSAMGMGSRIGVTFPAHCTAAGKALLAQMPPELLATVLGGEDLVALTPSSIRCVRELELELVEVRRRGYATNFEESEADTAAVAVAVPSPPGHIRSALAVAGPASRLRSEHVDEVVAVVARVAHALGRRLVDEHRSAA
jgi:IclR family transcriptional regulator, acetate operon repressor